MPRGSPLEGLAWLPRAGSIAAAPLAVLALLLSACNTANLGAVNQPPPPAVTVNAPAVAVDVAALPGKWGLASYRDEKDRARTQAEAKAACGNPYVIAKGSQGGVMMHLPDQAQPTELFVKVTADGRSFIGPKGAPGLPQDRVVMYFQGGVLVTEWLDASARERYGTMLFVRCA
jgi:hypothetical protein